MELNLAFLDEEIVADRFVYAKYWLALGKIRMKASMVNRRIINLVLGIVITIVIVPLCIVFTIPEGDYLVPFGRDSVDSVSMEFLRALADHQEGRLKSLSVDKLWPKIDQWLEDNQEVDCDSSLWWEPLAVPPITSEIIIEEPNIQRMHLVLSRECTEQELIHCVRMSDIRLILTDEGWIVEDWERVSEYLLPILSVCQIER